MSGWTVFINVDNAKILIQEKVGDRADVLAQKDTLMGYLESHLQVISIQLQAGALLNC